MEIGKAEAIPVMVTVLETKFVFKGALSCAVKAKESGASAAPLPRFRLPLPLLLTTCVGVALLPAAFGLPSSPSPFSPQLHSVPSFFSTTLKLAPAASALMAFMPITWRGRWLSS